MNKLQQCINNKKINHSSTREAIYLLFLKEKDALTITQIMESLHLTYPKAISINTVYRHLRLFMKCNLIFSIQDNSKSTYYFFNQENTSVIQLCTRCQKIQRVDLTLCEEMQGSDYITLHKKCKNCQ